MAAEDHPKKKKSDDAWKDRVKAEDRAWETGDADPSQVAAASASNDLPDDLDDSDLTDVDLPEVMGDLDARQLPPASMETLISMLATQAIVSLGMIPDPSTGQPQSRPNLARHLIDLLGVLEEKTRNNLSVNEQRMLGSSLHELRMAFLHVSQDAPKS